MAAITSSHFCNWRQVDKVEVWFRGHKGGQPREGSMVVRTRDAVQGARSGLRSDGAAVALIMELRSCHSMHPKHTPLASYRSKVIKS